MTKAILILAAAILIVVSAYLGLTRALGAHPFWDSQVAWIGAPVGGAVAVGLARAGAGLRTGLAFGVLTLALFGLAHYGKTAFAASYAEDRLAGQLWYFGWIATCAAATSALAMIATGLAARR